MRRYYADSSTKAKAIFEEAKHQAKELKKDAIDISQRLARRQMRFWPAPEEGAPAPAPAK